MKAAITSVEKALMPRFDNIANEDIPTLMVVCTVQFTTDDGAAHHSQAYAFLPEDVPTDGFSSQADAMQADVDHAKIQAVVDAQNKAADEKVAELQALITPQ